MDLDAVRCAPGAPAAAALAAAVARARGADRLSLVHVVVRAEDTAVHVRRAIARAAGGTAAIEALPLDRVARSLLARAGQNPARVASRPVLAAALRRAARSAGGPIGVAADQQATQDALVATHHELTALGDSGLAAAAALSGVGGTAARIVASARRTLAAAGWLDDAGMLAAAVAPARAGLVGAPVVTLRTEASTPVELALLDALAAGGVLTAVEAVAPAGAPASLDVRRVTDPDEEVRAAVRVLAQAMADGVPADRCALAYTVEQPYRRIAAELLDEAGLAWNGRAAGSLLESPAGRVALAWADSPGSAAPWREVAAALATELVEHAPDGATTRAVARVVGQLGALDALGAPPGPALLAATLRAELAAALPTVGRVGAGVSVGNLRRVADGAPWRVVVVVGLAEGWAPAGAAGASLLTDVDRAALGLATAADNDARQRSRLDAVVNGAERAYVTWPAADLRRTSRRSPSRWLAELVTDARAAGALVTEGEAPSAYAAVTARASPLALDRRRRLALAAPAALAASDDAFARPWAAAMARRSPTATAFDGDLTGADLRPLAVDGRAIAPTALERYASCGRAYFTMAVLRVDESRAVDELAGPDARTDGSLVHRMLERAVRAERRLDRPLTRAEQADVVGEALATRAAELDRLPALLREQHHRGLLARLWRAFDLDRELRESTGRAPHDVEVRFGDAEPFTIELPSGRHIGLHGSIDRVDRLADGSLTVLDYKTGSSLRRGTDDDPLLGGTVLQLAVYAAAAEARYDLAVDTVEYVLVARDKFMRSVAAAEPLRDALGPVVEVLVAGIERGQFLPAAHVRTRPGWGTCPVCDPHGLLARQQARRARLLAASVDRSDDDG